MTPELIAALAVILAAMAFDYTNGFHDAANAIATSVSTRALTPRAALAMAAVGNFIGAHLGAEVAKTVGDGLVKLPVGAAPVPALRLAPAGARPRRFPFAALSVGCPDGLPPRCRGERVVGKPLVRRPGGGAGRRALQAPPAGNPARPPR